MVNYEARTASGWTMVLVLVAGGALPPEAPTAQDFADRAFDVASIKRNESQEARSQLILEPTGRVTATNVSLRTVLKNIYHTQDFQIVGGPSWIDSQRFDIAAIAPQEMSHPPVPAALLQEMLRTLLRDRFKLEVRREIRQLPTFALEVVRADQHLGPQMKETLDCSPGLSAAANQPTPLVTPRQAAPCRLLGVPNGLIGRGVRMSVLVAALAPHVGRVVTDQTGLQGAYDFELKWTPEPANSAVPGGQDQRGTPIATDAPSLFSALQEQLGLRLTPARGPVEVLVIARVEMPLPD